jgi:hypothetical protein
MIEALFAGSTIGELIDRRGPEPMRGDGHGRGVR